MIPIATLLDHFCAAAQGMTRRDKYVPGRGCQAQQTVNAQVGTSSEENQRRIGTLLDPNVSSRNSDDAFDRD